MPQPPVVAPPILRELEDRLHQALGGRAHFDAYTRALYRTDGSIHEVEPLGVAFPRHTDELAAIMQTAAQLGVPLLPRGAGTGLAGQAVGAALIIDCARYLNRIIEIDPESRTALVEPGVVCGQLNKAAAALGLAFGPDPASADRATLGGMIGNNASGAHSIRYGMTADHVLALDTVLADGSSAAFGELTEAQAAARAAAPTLEGRIYSAMLGLRQDSAEDIRRDWPRTWRRASGYNLNYLIGYSPSAPPVWYAPDLPYPPVGALNLAPVITGSEGTLALIGRARLRLVPRPRVTVIVILAYPSAAEACDAAPEVLAAAPSAVELLPAELIRMAQTVPGYARRMTFASDAGQALLAAEFSGDTLAEALAAAAPLARRGRVLDSPAAQADLWAVRKAGMGLLMNQPGARKAVDFIEDMAVPVERLGEFVRRIDAILARHDTHGVWYAHASAGCLHVRPLLDLKSASGVAAMRAIAEESAAVVSEMRGTMSGEHGDGLSRGEFLLHGFGPRLLGAFEQVKAAFDPRGLLNPGKLFLPPGQRALDQTLRYGPTYRTAAPPTAFAFRREGGLAGAVEACVGAGVCLTDGGVMCPSFQATRAEADSTRGRANALRAALSGRLPPGALHSQPMHAILDLCLECKGCKAECPTGVDMARVKSEFLNHYQSRHGVPLRSRIFAEIAALGRAVRPVAGLANWVNRLAPFRLLLERSVGIDRRRPLPPFVGRPFSRWLRGRPGSAQGREVVLFVETHIEANYPELGQAAVRVLEAAGCAVTVAPGQGCCGRPMISKGLLARARSLAEANLAALAPYAERGVPILGLEPSCLLALRDEYLDFFPDDPRAHSVARAALLVEEFLTQPGPDGRRPVDSLRFHSPAAPWLLHGHCHAKSLAGSSAPLALMRAAGAQVDEIDSGCCGMAGSFGYEREHYDLSMQIGEMNLLPAARAADAQGVRLAAQGVSCRAQLADGAALRAVHPVEMLAEYLND